MIKRIVTCSLVVAILMAFLVFVPVSYAQSRLPDTSATCGTNCYAQQEWGSLSVHGATTAVQANVPNYSGSNSFYQALDVTTSNGYVAVGIESNNGFGVSCGSGDHFFYQIYDQPSGPVSQCFSVLSGEGNNYATFQISYYVSNGGGWFIHLIANGDIKCKPTPCTYNAISDSNATAAINDVQLQQSLVHPSSFSNHQIWGTDWNDNGYFTGSWSFFNTSGSGVDFLSNLGGSVPPPQMYWQTDPSKNVTGGNLYSCDYSSGTGCTIGS